MILMTKAIHDVGQFMRNHSIKNKNPGMMYMLRDYSKIIDRGWM